MESHKVTPNSINCINDIPFYYPIGSLIIEYLYDLIKVVTNFYTVIGKSAKAHLADQQTSREIYI